MFAKEVVTRPVMVAPVSTAVWLRTKSSAVSVSSLLTLAGRDNTPNLPSVFPVFTSTCVSCAAAPAEKNIAAKTKNAPNNFSLRQFRTSCSLFFLLDFFKSSDYYLAKRLFVPTREQFPGLAREEHRRQYDFARDSDSHNRTSELLIRPRDKRNSRRCTARAVDDQCRSWLSSQSRD